MKEANKLAKYFYYKQAKTRDFESRIPTKIESLGRVIVHIYRVKKQVEPVQGFQQNPVSNKSQRST